MLVKYVLKLYCHFYHLINMSLRYCFITLHDEAKVDRVMEDLKKIPFGVGFLHAEKKVQKPEENATYENIDPFTYVILIALYLY